MNRDEISRLLDESAWTLATLTAKDAPTGILRFRRPVPLIEDTGTYSQLLTIVWPYADEGSGELPDVDTNAEMEEFENHLSGALEADAHAIIAAVLTFDGARQWVVYTRDFEECGERISRMPHGERPYPIEMTADDDPEWSYLREQILRGVELDDPGDRQSGA